MNFGQTDTFDTLIALMNHAQTLDCSTHRWQTSVSSWTTVYLLLSYLLGYAIDMKKKVKIGKEEDSSKADKDVSN
jgi:hypothetical protein